MTQATFRVWRGADGRGEFRDYPTEVSEGMVVLDAIHQIQATQANDLAVRWNCKAASAGRVRPGERQAELMCMTRLNTQSHTEPVTVEPMRTFPICANCDRRKLNFRVKKKIRPSRPRAPDAGRRTWGMHKRRGPRAGIQKGCSSAFCARMCVTYCATIKNRIFMVPRFSPMLRRWSAPARLAGPDGRVEGNGRDLGTAITVLHHGVSGGKSRYRQRDHSAQGTRGRPLLRSAQDAGAARAWETEVVKQCPVQETRTGS